MQVQAAQQTQAHLKKAQQAQQAEEAQKAQHGEVIVIALDEYVDQLDRHRGGHVDPKPALQVGYRDSRARDYPSRVI